jgi:DNA-binding transcriptional ArsR family regulator
MTRQDAINALLFMLRPLGPEGDPTQREEEEAAWAIRAADDAQTMCVLIDLARSPPHPNEHARVTEDAFQTQLSHVLALAGAHAPAIVLEQVGPLTDDAKSRAIAIEVIGAIGAPDGLRWLAPLVDSGDISDDEAEWLASSLGDIGTAEASGLLDQLASRAVGRHASVKREIEIARDVVARRR